MAVKGPPPSAVRPMASRPPPKAKGSRSGETSRSAKAGGKSKAKGSPNVEAEHLGNVPVDTDEEERIGYERRHALDLEEEGRKHVSSDTEADVRRREDIEHEERMKRISWGEERKKRGRRNRRDDDDTEDGEEAAEAAVAAKARGLTGADGAGKYFQDMPEDRMGDPNLRDPNEMKRVLGPSVRFAQHAMLLAQSQQAEGASRSDALKYLAELYSRVGDRGYANKALREFGPATGILDIYPLEVVDHLMQHVPAFFNKTSRGRFLTSTTEQGYEAQAGEQIKLSYAPDLRIRGFAVKGGAKPGYLLEPIEPQGTYGLVFLTPGRFEVLISAIGKDGRVLVEEFVCTIAPGTQTEAELTALQRERDHQQSSTDPGEDAPPPKEKKKDDLTLNFWRRI